MLSQSTGAQILGFNVKVSSSAAKMAEIEKIKILNFKIIYELLEVVDRLLHPEAVEKIVGRATILAEFKYDNQRVAGGKVSEGELKKGQSIRVFRDDQVVGETRFKSLRSGKTEVQQVKANAEFGAVFVPHVDFKVGDNITAFEKIG
jgi:translation initiation factor IF-2